MKAFLSSGLFFVLLGALIIVLAYSLPDGRHPSIIYILEFLGLFLALLGTIVQLSGSGLNILNFSVIYPEVKAFFSSGVFYIIIGCLFLYVTFSLSDRAHSAFVYLLAILGVAIVLYGTGTQATGSNDSGAMKIAIAGGAGVLALVLGYGIVEKSSDIQKVFKRTLDYGILEIRSAGSSIASVNLDNYNIQARLPTSRPLHLWSDKSSIQVLVPIVDQTVATQVEITLTSRSGREDLQNSYRESYDIVWNSTDSTKKPESSGNPPASKKSDGTGIPAAPPAYQLGVKRVFGFNNEEMLEDDEELDLIKDQVAIHSKDESNSSSAVETKIAPQ